MAHGQAFTVSSRRPGACRSEDLASFESLVLEGGEVKPIGLQRRIKRAEILAFANDARTLIGVGALKRPDNDYQIDVFKKAGGNLLTSDFPFELGWVYVNPACRRDGVGQRIVDVILSAAADRHVFATARVENGQIHRRLERSGFVREGTAFPSELGAHMLILFVR